MVAIIRTHRRVVPAVPVQAFCDAVSLHLRCMQTLGIPERPKHHFLMEMGVKLASRQDQSIHYKGSPVCVCMLFDDVI